jgi:hypothetical protein
VGCRRGPSGERSRRGFLAFGAALLCLLLLPDHVLAARIELSAADGHGGERLAAALARAERGDSLCLAPGLYRGTFTLRSGVSIVGLGPPDSTILDAAGGRYVLFGRHIDSTTVVSGLTLENGRRDHANSGGGGIYLYASSPRIVNNIFRRHLGYLGPGVYMNQGCRPVIAWNVFHDIEGYLGGAIAAYLDCHPLIYNNVIAANRAVSGGGILCLNSAPVILANTLVGNRASQNGGAIYCDSSPALIRENVVAEHESTAAIYWLDDDRPAQILGNRFWKNAGGDAGGRCPQLIGRDGNVAEDPGLAAREPLALARAGSRASAGARPWSRDTAPVVPDSVLALWWCWVATHGWR